MDSLGIETFEHGFGPFLIGLISFLKKTGRLLDKFRDVGHFSK